MKEFESYKDVPKIFTGVCKLLISKSIHHYKNGKYHNENGPAVIYSDGSKHWYINGLQHREDGPAAQFANGKIIWYYKNVPFGYNGEFTVESWKEKVENLKREESLKIFI